MGRGAGSAGAVRVGGCDGGLPGAQQATQIVATGAAALAIVTGVGSGFQRGGSHRLNDAGRVLLSRSSRDIALALDARDGVTGGLCRPVTGSVGKGLRSLRIAYEPTAAAIAKAFASYAAPSIPIALLASNREPFMRGERLFDQFDVLLSADLSAADIAQSLAVPLAPDRDVFVCGMSSEAIVRVGAVIDALILSGNAGPP